MRFYSQLILVLTLGVCLSAIKPMSNNEKDIMVLNKLKTRPYYSSSSSPLVYEVDGPIVIKMISRSRIKSSKAYSKKSFAMGYDVIMNNKKVDENYYVNKIDPNVASKNFSGYAYSKSNSYLLSIPSGKHRIKIKPHGENLYPMCLRVIKQELDQEEDQRSSRLIHPNEVLDSYQILKSSGSVREYYKLNNQNNIQLNIKGPKMLKIISRLDIEGENHKHDYGFTVEQDGYFLGNYTFKTEPSSSKLRNDPQKVIGKWRACRVYIPEGKHYITIKNPNEETSIFMKFSLYE